MSRALFGPQAQGLEGFGVATERQGRVALRRVVVLARRSRELLVEVREFRDAQDGRLARDDASEPVRPRRVQLGPGAAARQRALDATFALDVLEALPRFASQRIGDRFEVIRAARRVLDLAERALFTQHEAGVAGDAPAEGRGGAEPLVERRRRDPIGAAEDGREHLGRRPQHVHPGITLRHRSRRADRVHRGLLDLSGPRGDQHFAPRAPQRPQLAHLAERVAAHGRAERHEAPRRGGRDPAVDEPVEIRSAGRERERNLVGRIGARVVVRQRRSHRDRRLRPARLDRAGHAHHGCARFSDRLRLRGDRARDTANGSSDRAKTASDGSREARRSRVASGDSPSQRSTSVVSARLAARRPSTPTRPTRRRATALRRLP